MNIKDFKQLLTSLKKFHQKLIVKHEFSDLLSQLDKKTVNNIHPYKLHVLDTKFQQILQKNDKRTYEEIRKIVLLECIVN